MKKSIKSMPAIVICLIIILIGYITYTVWSNSQYVGAKKEFNKNFEAYVDIKDFIIKEIKKMQGNELDIKNFIIKGMQGNELSGITIGWSGKKWYYYFSSQDRMSVSESYDISDQNVLDNLNLLREIEKTRFDFCGGRCFEKYKIIVFVYDWECAYDRRYNIYWCDNIDILKSYLQNTSRFDKYDLKKLESNWYYVAWK